MRVSVKGAMARAMDAAAGSGCWGRAALLALALQLRSAWVLLDPWFAWGGEASRLSSLRIMPAHPDWYLAALAQSCATALTLVGLARRLGPAWVVTAAAAAGAAAWGLTSFLVPNGPEGLLLALGVIREVLTMAVILACVAMTWTLARGWTAVAVVAVLAGAADGAIPLLLSNTVFRSAWPEGWPRDLAVDVVGVALLAAALALFRRRDPDLATGPLAPGAAVTVTGLGARRANRDGVLVGVSGLLLLALLHLTAGFLVSRWSVADSLRLAAAAALFALVVCAALTMRNGSHEKTEEHGAATRR